MTADLKELRPHSNIKITDMYSSNNIKVKEELKPIRMAPSIPKSMASKEVEKTFNSV